MADNAKSNEASTPQSPEKQDEYVREELDQDMITHQGDYRQASSEAVAPAERSKHLGATDDEVVPITPPMAGPADIVGEHDEDAQGNDGKAGHEMIDPHDELTPG